MRLPNGAVTAETVLDSSANTETRMDLNDVTMVQGAIHNPDEPRHFMTITPANRVRSASIDGTEVARSDRAVVVKEIGRSIYDPVVYFPRADVTMDRFEVSERSTHCPLKGDTEYFDFIGDQERIPDAAWSYVRMALGDELKQLIAFDPARIEVT
jgi:uncharacterized protein (DUF427 family)